MEEHLQHMVELHDEECSHYWLIESPNGPTSLGVCQLCNQGREFRNSLPGSTWERVHYESNDQPIRVKETKPEPVS